MHSFVFSRTGGAPLVLGLAVCALSPRVASARSPRAHQSLSGISACMLAQGAGSSGWAAALRALGVPIVSVRNETIASEEAFVSAARARGLAPVCGLRAHPDGATVWLYRSRLGGHGELLEATLGPAPPAAGEASMVLALRLRLEMLSQSPTGTGRFIPARRPVAPAPLPPEAGLDFAPPPLTPLPERPAADLPTPLSERVAPGSAPSAYEVTLEAPDADAVRVEPAPISQASAQTADPWSLGIQTAAYGLGPSAFVGAMGVVLRTPSLVDDHAVRLDLGWAPLVVRRDSASLGAPWRLNTDLAWSAPLAAEFHGVVAGAVEAEIGDTDDPQDQTTARFRFGPRVGVGVLWPALGDATFQLTASALWATSGAPAFALHSTVVWPLF